MEKGLPKILKVRRPLEYVPPVRCAASSKSRLLILAFSSARSAFLYSSALCIFFPFLCIFRSCPVAGPGSLQDGAGLKIPLRQRQGMSFRCIFCNWIYPEVLNTSMTLANSFIFTPWQSSCLTGHQDHDICSLKKNLLIDASGQHNILSSLII